MNAQFMNFPILREIFLFYPIKLQVKVGGACWKLDGQKIQHLQVQNINNPTWKGGKNSNIVT